MGEERCSKRKQDHTWQCMVSTYFFVGGKDLRTIRERIQDVEKQANCDCRQARRRVEDNVVQNGIPIPPLGVYSNCESV